ncbi:hypothetical protein [Erythrobacter sp. EC-HK427]|uniref:hypothetical protein n=1 Tax=Erythrobacter sp. EC-HK427 TaxID=2038396 RepID=UPI001256E9E6|nr:hypothetical protein [Erythrobacter sp. EC-HK427]VVS99619.1 conserved membrane hypothetical protein [Erythrobacter sp. EC-HK427]
MPRLTSRIRPRVQPWDRFAGWAPGAAMLALAFFALLLLGAGLTARDTTTDRHYPAEQSTAQTGAANAESDQSAPQPAPATRQRDTDLALYSAIAERVAAGEDYYSAAVAEQRARNFPVRPGLTVRLPTLAQLAALLGQWGLFALALLLLGGTLAAWHYRLRDEPGGPGKLRYILLLVVLGSTIGLKPQYVFVHEVWAGLLVALSLALIAPGRWAWALLPAAAALAIRELALPFVMLMGALAILRGERLQAMAWGGLVLLFIGGLLLHLSYVDAVTSAADPASPSWLALRGLTGWTSNIVLTSPLYLLPHWLAAPLALLPLIGWAGWRSPFGLTGFLLCAGYGVMFMIAGRDNNFYWALTIMPVWFVGLAFTPRALGSLWNSARGY